MFKYIFIFSILISISSCKKKKIETPPDLGYDYAPITLGKYVVYDVDSTVYDDFLNDTLYFKYRIKEKLQETYIDNEGRNAVKMIRYVKIYNPLISYDNMAWTIKDVWNYTRTKTTLEVVEEDVRFTKLIFGVNEGVTWNGNANNTLGELNYKYLYINNTETINGHTLENVLCVEQKDDKLRNAIRRQLYVEKYAKNIGLVYREIKDLTAGIVTLGVPVEQRIKFGIIYKLNYVTHGIE